jgi:hypothetical protein
MKRAWGIPLALAVAVLSGMTWAGDDSITLASISAAPAAVAQTLLREAPRAGEVQPLEKALKEAPTLLARGEQCPNGSGKYCPDQFPACCMIRGQWTCRAKREYCRE